MVLRRILFVVAMSCLLNPLSVRAQTAQAGERTRRATAKTRDSFDQGAFHYQAGRWDQAAVAFDDFVTAENLSNDDPREIQARFYLGEALIQLQRYDESIATFEQYLAIVDPNDANRSRASFQLGVAAFALNDWSLADRSLRRFLDESTRIGAHGPLESAARQRLADVCFETEKYEEAASLFGDLAKEADNDEQRWEAKYGQGRSLELATKRDEAEQVYLEIADEAATPHGDRALLALGLMDYGIGDFRNASGVFHCLADQFPKSPFLAEAYYWTGRSLIQQSDPTSAIDALDTAKSLFSETHSQRFRSAVHYFSGLAHFKHQDVERAKRELRLALQATGDHEATWGKRSRDLLARISAATTSANTRPGSQNVEPLQSDMDDSALRVGRVNEFELAEQQRANGDIELATRTYLRIAAMNPQSADAARALLEAARCYEQSGHTDDAVELLTRLREQRTRIAKANGESASTRR